MTTDAIADVITAITTAGLDDHVSSHGPAAFPRLAVKGAGATLRDVQDYAGHKDRRPTRRYGHARDSLDRNAAYAVAAYLA